MSSKALAQRGGTLAPGQSELKALLRSFWGDLSVVGFFSIFINLLMLVPPLYMLQVYDRVMISRSESTLLMLTLIVILLFITMGLLEFVRARMLNRLGAQVEMRLSERVFEAMFRASLVNPAMTHAQALEDLKSIRAFISGRALTALIDLPWVPIFIGLLFIFHPLYGAFGVFAGTVLLILAIANEWSTKQPTEDANGSATFARNIAASQTRNAEVVQAMGMMDRLRQRWQSAYDRYLLSQGDASDRASVWMTLSKNVRILSQSLMLGIGGYLAINLEVSAGMIIAGSIVLGRALAPLDQLIGSWKQFVTARTSIKRLDELLLEFPLAPEPMSLPEPTGHLRVEGLVLAPPRTQRIVLRGVDFELEPGEMLGVVGPSGAGKSSLARGLLAVWPVVAGKVRLDGADLAQWNRKDLGAHVGYLPQDIELFAGTVAENIARFQEVDSEAVVDAAKRVDVHDLILRLPEGYDTQIGPSGSILSGGQRQRIALARAIYKSPCLVILDEPNASLDEAGDAALLQALHQLKASKTTVVIISHKQGILMQVDKILALKDGAVLRMGLRDEMLQLLLPQNRAATAIGGGKSVVSQLGPVRG